jgi:hypothetical protein
MLHLSTPGMTAAGTDEQSDDSDEESTETCRWCTPVSSGHSLLFHGDLMEMYIDQPFMGLMSSSLSYFIIFIIFIITKGSVSYLGRSSVRRSR